MLFKNPALLYGLFFLVIPIIVHLFQLRRFQKVAFTNVAFLKPLVTTTRKSQQLKKWLTLLARLLAITCLVFAFAQPYVATDTIANADKELAIYLDNSYSMQAAGSAGPLYTTAVNQLLEKLPADKEFTLFTNNNVYVNATKQQIANDLLTAGYSNNTLTFKQIQLKAASLLNGRNKAKSLVIISDFQKRGNELFPDTLAGLKRELVKLTSEKLDNISIDTAYIASREGNNLKIALSLSASTTVSQPVTVSLNKRGVLLSKTSVDLSSKKATTFFDINLKEPLTGELIVEDKGLDFDNHLYISTAANDPIKVLTINDANDQFIKKIYTEPDFKLTSVGSAGLNYNLINEQNLIILNEVKNISAGLAQEINDFLDNGGHLVFIPHEEAVGCEAIRNIPKAPVATVVEKKITTINTNHPLLSNVFSGEVDNFQYPSVSKTIFNSETAGPVIKFQDGTSFLYNTANTYIFTAPINTDNSNFQNSPLIVPVFYNMGISSLPLPQLYFALGKENEIAIPTVIGDDQILKLQQDDLSIIPQQRGFNSYVLLQTNSSIEKPGTYTVLKDKEALGSISFNSSRVENKQDYFMDNQLGSDFSQNIDDVMYNLFQEDSDFTFWKYFMLGAFFFLICELLILKLIP